MRFPLLANLSSLMGARKQYGNQNCPVIEHRQPAIYVSLPRSMKQREQRTCEWEIKKERVKSPIGGALARSAIPEGVRTARFEGKVVINASPQ